MSLDKMCRALDAHDMQALRALATAENVNKRNSTNKQILHFASRAGNVEAMTIIVGAGADVNANANPNASCTTPLREAAIGGHLEAIRYLVSRGADVNKGCQPNPPFGDAFARGKIEAAILLFDLGANVQPLCWGDDPDHIRIFLDARINKIKELDLYGLFRDGAEEKRAATLDSLKKALHMPKLKGFNDRRDNTHRDKLDEAIRENTRLLTHEKQTEIKGLDAIMDEVCARNQASFSGLLEEASKESDLFIKLVFENPIAYTVKKAFEILFYQKNFAAFNTIIQSGNVDSFIDYAQLLQDLFPTIPPVAAEELQEYKLLISNVLSRIEDLTTNSEHLCVRDINPNMVILEVMSEFLRDAVLPVEYVSSLQEHIESLEAFGDTFDEYAQGLRLLIGDLGDMDAGPAQHID